MSQALQPTALIPAPAARGELAGVLRVPFDVAAEAIGLVEGTHHAIAARAFGATGVFGQPARAVHDGVSAAVYRALRGGAQALGRGVSAAAQRVLPEATQDVSRTPRGANLLGAVNGVIGDRLALEGNGAAVRLAVRAGGRSVSPDRASIGAAFPDATPKLAVFVHGLCGSEHSWTPPGQPDLAFGRRLRADLGYTPVLVRYNSGLHVSENGRALAQELELLVAAWPVEVAEVILIGHSMGGLVSRSACHYGRGALWTERLRHVICLGTPHLGAPLEKAVNVATHGLGVVGETRAFATFLNRRSVGIKDLRFGAVVDEDWLDRDPDAFLQDHSVAVEPPESARQHAIAATVTTDHRHPVGQLVGDLLVRMPSATGQGRRRQVKLELAPDHHLGGAHHLHLLHHPAVYARIRAILDSP